MREKIDTNTLDKFCIKDGVRRYHPFSDNQYSYFCDGSILVAVPKIDGIVENPKMIAKLENIKSDLLNPQVKTWIPLKKVVNTLVFTECCQCKGQGYTFECLECDGSGEIEWETLFNDYSDTCLSCNGGRTVDRDTWIKMAKRKHIEQDTPGNICDHCEGIGKIYVDTPILIGGIVLSLRYLSMLGELPGCEIGILYDHKAAFFKFDSGRGLVMSMIYDSSICVAYDDLEFNEI